MNDPAPACRSLDRGADRHAFGADFKCSVPFPFALSNAEVISRRQLLRSKNLNDFAPRDLLSTEATLLCNSRALSFIVKYTVSIRYRVYFSTAMIASRVLYNMKTDQTPEPFVV